MSTLEQELVKSEDIREQQIVTAGRLAKTTKANKFAADENFRSIFENSTDAIMTLDPPTWKFTSCNPATLKMFNVPDEKHFANYVPWLKLSPRYQPDGKLSKVKAKEMIAKALKCGSNLFEWEHRRLSGEVFPASVLLTKVELPGHVFCQATVRDLSESKKAEKQIKSSEERFRQIYEGAMDGIVVMDIKTKDIVFGNPSVCSMLGYSTKELSKLNMVDIHPKADLAMVKKELEKQLAGITPLITNVPVLKKDGTVIYCDINAKKVVINDREVMLGFFRDITQQKIDRERLIESEYFFKESQRAGNIGSYKLDFKTGMWTASEVLNKIFGISANYKKSVKGWLNLIHPDDKKMMELYFANEVVAGHKQFNKEYRLAKDNCTRDCWVLGLGKVEYGPDGKPLFMIGTIQDITERKSVEMELKRVHERRDAILASIGDAVFACDNFGKLNIFNRVAEELTGVKIDDALGKHYSKVINFVRESDGMPCNDFIADSLKHHKTTELSNHALLVRKDGSKIPVADSAAPIINPEGEQFGCVVIFREVIKERSIDKAKTEFVSLASHQLRTPLSTINWYSEILLSEEIGKLTPKQRQYTQEVYRASQRMVALVNALLNVSRLELGTFAVEPKHVNIVRIAQTSLKELSHQIDAKNLRIVEKYDKDEATVKVDPKLIGIIFSNLFSNSVKYSKKNGKIVITIGERDGSILVTVEDSGIGIPNEQQKEIFTKLFRADNAKMTDPDGTGLGLYIVKEIINYAGGNVWFESREGKGTKFYVKLPLSGMKKKISNKRLI